jgi:hypothetical protein
MKLTNYLLIIVMAGILALAGCGKSNSTAKTPRQPGIVDLQDLVKAFPSPSPEVKASLDKLPFAVAGRVRQFDVALAELEKLAQTPNLTAPQQAAIADAIDQVKQAIALRASRPAK